MPEPTAPRPRGAGSLDPHRVHTLAELDAVDPVAADEVRRQAGLPPKHQRAERLPRRTRRPPAAAEFRAGGEH